MSIQKVELNTYYDVSIHCPFCGQLVVDNSGKEDVEFLHPCNHTLFFAHDEGFEYRSAALNENLGLSAEDTDGDVDADEGYDALTDGVSIVDSIKIAAYVGAPSGFGSYVGFAPSAAE
jgi:hypothetical protein